MDGGWCINSNNFLWLLFSVRNHLLIVCIVLLNCNYGDFVASFTLCTRAGKPAADVWKAGCSELTSWSATTSTPGRPLRPGSSKLGRGSLAEGSCGPSTHPPGPRHRAAAAVTPAITAYPTPPVTHPAEGRQSGCTQEGAGRRATGRPWTKTYLHLQAVSAPRLFWKNDRVVLIRVMTKDKEWKGVWEEGVR